MKKFIFWELISPYDGYNETELDSWEECVERMKVYISSSKSKVVKQLFNQWKKGKISDIRPHDDENINGFVTSNIVCQ